MKSLVIIFFLSLAFTNILGDNTKTIFDVQQQPFPGNYIVTGIQATATQVIAQLKFDGTAQTYITQNNPIVPNLVFWFNFDNANEFNIRINDALNERFTMPYNIPFPFTKNTNQIGPFNFQYKIAQLNQPFFIQIWRNDTGETIFNTTGYQLMYSNLYLQITTSMQFERIYGLGERNMKFLFSSGNYTIWNKDQPGVIDSGNPNGEVYGTHPMYLRKEKSGKYHVGFLRNSNGMLVQYNQNQSLTFQIGGGIIEFKYFIGQNPEEVVKRYHQYINGWSLHPFWATGYHQCRWGWANTTEWMNVWNTYNTLGLPIDALWSDIDYMLNYQDFTIDTTNYNVTQMNTACNLSNPNGVHWVPIIDAGIAINTNPQYSGLAMDTFIKSGKYNQSLVGCVWPGPTNYVDFNHPNSSAYWYQGLSNITQVYGGPQPSGFWIDMNEFSNFKPGEIPPNGNCNNNDAETESPPPQHDAQEYFMYKRNLKLSKKRLRQTSENKQLKQSQQYPFYPNGPDHPWDEKTLSMDALHYNENGANYIQFFSENITEYDFHNLDGFTEGIATNQALKKMNFTLPFIISRSTFFGSGAYVQHWTGDNVADWTWLQVSIPTIFNFQLFGIPFVGADICGFSGNTTAELCARWMQLGLFYPFSRNHGAKDSNEHEPYSFPNDPYVLQSSNASMHLKYQFLKYYYSLFVKSNGTGTIFRPLFFEFPNDTNLETLESQFMVGDLMFAPVLIQGETKTNTTQISFYVPQNSTFFNVKQGTTYTQGSYQITVPFNATIPMFLKAGAIVHIQNVNVTRSRQLNNQFSLLIALNKTNQAKGQILSLNNYNSDSNVYNLCVANNCVLDIYSNATIGSFSMKLQLTVTSSSLQTVFDQIQIVGVNIYGVQSRYIIPYVLSQPWIIQSNSSITLSIMI